MAETETLPLDRITTEGTQARLTLSEDIIGEYAEALDRGDEFPAIDAYFDGHTYWLADGFHRVEAAKRAELVAMAARVHPGGKREALLHALGANETHGHRRTDADRRHAASLMLADEEWRQWSNSAIAHQCRVSEHLVRILRSELEPARETTQRRRKATRGGTAYTMDTGRIGRATPRKRIAPGSLQPTTSTAHAPIEEPIDLEEWERPAVLSSTQSKIDTLPAEEPTPRKPAAPLPATPGEDTEPRLLQRTPSLLKAWAYASVEEKQQFVSAYRDDLLALLSAHPDPGAVPQTPQEYKAWVMQQMITWKREGKSTQAIADELNQQRLSTFSGRGTWNRGTVAKLLAREHSG